MTAASFTVDATSGPDNGKEETMTTTIAQRTKVQRLAKQCAKAGLTVAEVLEPTFEVDGEVAFGGQFDTHIQVCATGGYSVAQWTDLSRQSIMFHDVATAREAVAVAARLLAGEKCGYCD